MKKLRLASLAVLIAANITPLEARANNASAGVSFLKSYYDADSSFNRDGYQLEASFSAQPSIQVTVSYSKIDEDNGYSGSEKNMFTAGALYVGQLSKQINYQVGGGLANQEYVYSWGQNSNGTDFSTFYLDGSASTEVLEQVKLTLGAKYYGKYFVDKSAFVLQLKGDYKINNQLSAFAKYEDNDLGIQLASFGVNYLFDL